VLLVSTTMDDPAVTVLDGGASLGLLFVLHPDCRVASFRFTHDGHIYGIDVFTPTVADNATAFKPGHMIRVNLPNT
jgi:hypothetical protein